MTGIYRRKALNVLSVLLASLFSPQLIASEIQLGILEMTPYAYKTDQNNFTGALYEVALLLQNHKITSSELINVDVYPGIRVLKSLESENNFCTIAANTPDLTIYDLVEPIGMTIGAGIVPKKGVVLEEYSQLTSLTIAVPAAIQFDEKFHNDTSLTKVITPEYANAVEMLVKNRVDAIAGGIQPIKNAAMLRGYDLDIFAKPLTFFEADIFLICNDTVSSGGRAALKETVMTLRESGEIEEILSNYF